MTSCSLPLQCSALVMTLRHVKTWKLNSVESVEC